MNILSRTITGAIMTALGLVLTALPFFIGGEAFFVWIYGIPLLIFGLIIFFNSKEDKIEGEIILKAKAEQDQLVIIISDTGLGIPEDEQSKIFEKFYRVKSHRDQVPGTGLGLSIVKQIIHGHGGMLDLTSEVDVGTTFTIALPYEV